MKQPQVPRNFGELFVEALNPAELKRIHRSISNGAIGKLGTEHKDLTIQKAIVRSLRRPYAPSNIVPAWLRLLSECLTALRLGSTPCRPHHSLAANITTPIVRFFVKSMVATQGERINRFLVPSAWRSLEASLAWGLAWTGRFAVERDWAVFNSSREGLRPFRRVPSRRKGVEAYFDAGVEQRTIAFLCTHAAMARLWMVQSEAWCRRTSELLCHIGRLAAKLSSPNRRLPVTMVEPDRSDWHRGNRAVVRVRLKDRTEWFYKPRSGKGEAFWTAVLRFCAPLAGRHFHTPRLIMGDGHFWMESVSHTSCENVGEVAEFYLKSGIVLFLLFRLRGVDFHADNMIAHRTDPILVDCETLLHPPVDPLLKTIRGIGFLPSWERPPNIAADSLSALGRVRFGPHSVMVGDRQFYARDFCESVVAGFTLLGPGAAAARPLTTAALEKIRQKAGFRNCRLLFRSTGEYRSILNGSLQPAVVVNSRVRRHYLMRRCRCNAAAGKVIREEVAALEQADIPIFYGEPAWPRRVTEPQLERQTKMLFEVCRALPVATPTTSSVS